MDFFEVISKRYSIRAFQDKEIEEEKLQKILETANHAPSAGNLQAYEIFIVKDLQKKTKLVSAAIGQEFIAQAPVVLVFCAQPARSSWNYGERGESLYSVQDATIAACFAQLASTALGLASCWVGAFQEHRVLEILENPGGLIPICIMPIGYPAEKPHLTQRRKLKDIVHEV